MKRVLIPTRDNAWMMALWLPMLFGLTLTPSHSVRPAVVIAVSMLEVAVLIWVLLRMKIITYVEFQENGVSVARKGKCLKELAPDSIERIVLSGATFSIYGPKRTFPVVTRALQVRDRQDKEKYFRDIREWGRRHRVTVQG